MSWMNRIAGLLRPKRLEAELDDEVQFHIEARVRQYLAEGLTTDEARRQARLAVGSASYDTSGGWSAGIGIEGRPAIPGEDNEVGVIAAGPDWFAIGLGLPSRRASRIDPMVALRYE